MSSENTITAYLELVFSDSETAPTRVDLGDGVVTMGREAGNTVVWDSLQVSRKHAVMEYFDNSWKLKDLSTNGVAVNTTRIRRNVFVDLKDSDLISFIPTGALQYRFVKVTEPKTHHTIVLDSSLPSDSSTQQQLSVSSIRSTTNVGISPKRKIKTNSGLNDQARKRKRILFNTPQTPVGNNLNNEELMVIDSSSPDFFMVAESPSSSFSDSPASSAHQLSVKPLPMEHEARDVDSNSDDSEDMPSIKRKLKIYQERIRDLEIQNNKLKSEKHREVGALKNKISSAQSECRVFKEELYKQLMEVLENEFSCCICNEVFIQATVIDCGHTFCGHCISEWVKRKSECPNCRKHVRIQVKHVEMENFISKLHTMFSDEIRKRREQIIADRSREIRQVKEAAAARSTSSRGGARSRLGGLGGGSVEFSFAPDRLVDFLAELQQINDMFVPNRRAPHQHVPNFSPPNFGAAVPDVGRLSSYALPSFHHEQLLGPRAAHLGGGGSRRRSPRISMRGGGRPSHPPVLGVGSPGGIGRGNPPNMPVDAHLPPDFGISPMDILTVD